MRGLSRHGERSEAIQLLGHKAGLLRRFAPRNDGVRYSGDERECTDPAVIASAAKQSSF
jgi:hypothetical protein